MCPEFRVHTVHTHGGFPLRAHHAPRQAVGHPTAAPRSVVLSNDDELVGDVQRAVGYAASADTREQCFFVLHGEGANGKSTFLNAVRSVLGTYAKHTPNISQA